MKTLLIALAVSGASLAGCAVVPYGPAPVVYAAPPPPVVVVRPYASYGYHRGPYWRHGWLCRPREWPGGWGMGQPRYDSVKDEAALTARFAGRQRLKNIDEPVAIWHVIPEGTAVQAHYASGVLEATPNNLPLQLTSFIGREGELADVAKLLAQSRLLTLLGFGGIGKSRLSLELGAQVLPDFADGVWLVELATLRDPPLVAPAGADLLGAKATAGRPGSEKLERAFS